MTPDTKAFHLTLARIGAATLFFSAVAMQAQAETGPYYFGARQTFTYDTNVDRSPVPTSDGISSTGIFGGIDQQLGRQRLSGNLSANWNRYQDISRLNHTDGNGLLRLDWETVGDLSGDAQVAHNRSLYRDFTSASSAGQKVIVRSTDSALNARLGASARWTLEGGVSASRTRFDDPLRANDIDYDGYRLGVSYNPNSLLRTGVSLRRTHGSYPNAMNVTGVSIDSSFDRDDIDLNTTWRPTGSSTLQARITRSKLDYKQASARSTNITTGAITYQWRPGGRLALDLSFVRDTNAGQYAFDEVVLVGRTIVRSENLSVDNRVTNTLGLVSSYQLTAKIGLSLDAHHVERKLDNGLTETILGLPTTTYRSADERTDSVNLSAAYDLTRTVRFSCGFGRTKRTVSDASSGLTYPYSVNLTNCTAQLALQP